MLAGAGQFGRADQGIFAYWINAWLRRRPLKYIGFGGLAVDKELRVIKQDGKPIPNLYAAGEIIGSAQTMGRSHCGGMCVTPALTFGRLLGSKMLKFSA